jgi:hypothetical protein
VTLRQRQGESTYFTQGLIHRFQSGRQRGKDHSRNLLIVDTAYNKARRPKDQAYWLGALLTDPTKPVNTSPRLRRALLAFIAVAAYSAEVATSATKAGSYGVFGERE